MELDFSTATSFADLPALMQVATTVVAGVAQWPANRFVLGRGAASLACDASVDEFISTCVAIVSDYEDPPELSGVFVDARIEGKSAAEAYGAVLQKVVLFLFGRPDHGGLRAVGGLVALPSAFPAPPVPPVAAAAAEPAVSPPAAAEPASEEESGQAAKRARVDAGGDGAAGAPKGGAVETPPHGTRLSLTRSSPQDQVREVAFSFCFTPS